MTKYAVEVINVSLNAVGAGHSGKRRSASSVAHASSRMRCGFRYCPRRPVSMRPASSFAGVSELRRIEASRKPPAATSLVPVIVNRRSLRRMRSPLSLTSCCITFPPQSKDDDDRTWSRSRRVRVDSDIDTKALGRILDCVLGLR